jgi:outer membrane immunogenic protein
MRKLLLGSVALFALSAGSPAVAADMPVKARPAPPPAVYSWSGCYGGGFVGYGWGNSQHRSVDTRTFPGFENGVAVSESGLDANQNFRAFSGDITPSFDMSGALGGFNFGCQAQFGWWLIGIEGDGAVTNKDGQAFNNFLGFVDPSGTNLPNNRFFVSQTTERWMATARLRLGWAADKWLFFITGGGAWSGVDVTVWDSLNAAITAHHKRTLTGWTVGAGWEYALGYGWSWKSEFLYIDYGWTRFFDPAESCSPSCDAFLTREVNLKNYVFRTGLNYKFDWGWGKAPVAVMAKY